jgi:glycerol kinase
LAGSRLLVGRLADLLGRPIDLAEDGESTALGTAILAAIGAGRLDETAAAAVARTERRVEPGLDDATRRAERAAWQDFIRLGVALAPGAAPGHAS